MFDRNGEQPITKLVHSIEQTGSDGVVEVQMHDRTRHGLEDGDFITFTEVEGLEELNGMDPVAVTVPGPFAVHFTPSVPLKGKHLKGGYMKQVKVPVDISFQPLKTSLRDPGELLVVDFAKMDRPTLLHAAFQALDDAEANVSADFMCASTASRLGKAGLSEEDTATVTSLWQGRKAVLNPVAAFLGGVVGQEVLISVSGKFSPLKQWFYFDAVECLPAEIGATQAVGSRYDDQIAVFGKPFVDKLNGLHTFLVGAGAIGCEMLKNFAMLGVGNVVVTDLDTISLSNLSRQFLFRPKDIGKSKSTVACEVAKAMNPNIQLKAYLEKVGADTEKVFTDDFMASLDMIVTALDNVEARLYMDQRCVSYSKPLLESGTLGTKGNTQVVIPNLTENYGASRDPPEATFPICTIKNFPSSSPHTLQWAREWFEGEFQQTPSEANSYLDQANYSDKLKIQRLETLTNLEAALVSHKPTSYKDCVEWARLQFEKMFSTDIKQLLYQFPADMLSTQGTPFWSGTKRVPDALVFDLKDELHMSFLDAVAKQRASVYGIKADSSIYAETVSSMNIPAFSPKSSVKIAANDAELKAMEEEELPDVDKLSAQIVAKLPAPVSVKTRLSPAEFEKDDDMHMKVVWTTSNLRSRNYRIEEVNLHEARRIAGKIIPAIATTTALVTGLVCMELYKIVAEKKDIEAYKNGFVNLALPFFAFSEPMAAPPGLWDKVALVEKMTLREFLAYFKEKHGADVMMLSQGVCIVYSSFAAKPERMDMEMAQLVEHVSQTKIDPSNKFITFECICVDDDGEDIEVPSVTYKV